MAEKGSRLRSRTSVLVFALGLYSIQPAFAMSGNEWNNFSKDVQDAYIIGVLETWSHAESVCIQLSNANCEYIKFLVQPLSCFPKSPYNQFIAIVRKYMQDHPEGWEKNMVSTIRASLSNVCKVNP